MSASIARAFSRSPFTVISQANTATREIKKDAIVNRRVLCLSAFGLSVSVFSIWKLNTKDYQPTTAFALERRSKEV